MIRVELPWPPLANEYWRVFHGRMVTTEEAKEFKRNVRLKMQAEGHRTPTQADVGMRLDVFRPSRRPDLDGAGKVTLDALQGTLYVNDSQIEDLRFRRFLDPVRPRVEVFLWVTNETPEKVPRPPQERKARAARKLVTYPAETLEQRIRRLAVPAVKR